jgi:hypothetical protein
MDGGNCIHRCLSNVPEERPTAKDLCDEINCLLEEEHQREKQEKGAGAGAAAAGLLPTIPRSRLVDHARKQARCGAEGLSPTLGSGSLVL